MGGIYEHYKGHIYKVIGTAMHSETLEDLVIYVNTEDPGKLWARPKEMFLENVAVRGKSVPRFKLVKKPL